MYNEQKDAWDKTYTDKKEIAYPAEYVVRIFKGHYPNLNFIDAGYNGKSILEVGCGDGRHMGLFQSLGFEKIAGTEITKDICDSTENRLKALGINADIRVGKNNALGFDDESFDFLLSWNVCYYLDEDRNFESHVSEYARKLKRGGVLIFSIPTKECFVYKDGIEKDGYMEIKDDWFKIRNGSVQRVFENEEEIEKAFGSHFNNFTFGRINDDCFGLHYNWFIGYCYKK